MSCWQNGVQEQFIQTFTTDVGQYMMRQFDQKHFNKYFFLLRLKGRKPYHVIFVKVFMRLVKALQS